MRLSVLTAVLVLAAGSMAAQTTFDCHFDLGKGKGFWHNKNGKATLLPHDTAWRDALNNLNLVDSAGNAYDVPVGDFDAAHADFAAWIVAAQHGNMASILSTHLAATVLNVEAGGFGTLTDPHVDWMGNKVLLSTVIADASALLGTHPLTTEPSAERNLQEAYKDLFESINEGLSPVCEPMTTSPPASAVLGPGSTQGSGDDPGAGCTTGLPALPWAALLGLGILVLRRRRAW